MHTPSKSKSSARVSPHSSSPHSSGSMSPASSASSAALSPLHTQGLTDAQAQTIWRSLHRAILEIQQHNASKLRFEELYRNAYTLVLHKRGELLYRGVRSAIEDEMLNVISRVHAVEDEGRLLQALCGEYRQHILVMTLVKDVLMYMDKSFCRPHKLVTVYDLGLLLFRDKVVRDPHIHTRLRLLLLDAVRREREGELVDRLLLKECLSMLVHVNVLSLEVYQLDFEQPFLQQTAAFYRQEAQRLYGQLNCMEYMRECEKRMKEEEGRCDSYLDVSSRVKVRQCVSEELIGKYAKVLVDDEKSGCRVMMRGGLADDLQRMYSLFSTAASLQLTKRNASPTNSSSPVDYIRDAMSSLIKQLGSAVVNEKESGVRPQLFVEQCLAIRQQYGRYVERSFMNDRAFVRALKESIESYMNVDGRSAQYLSAWVDELMRKQVKGMSEAEVDARLNDVIAIFRYLQDKDVFEEYYKQQLAQRLLAGGAANEAERSLIGKLKAECGHQYTSRLEGMFKDMELSKALMKQYAQGAPPPPLPTTSPSSPASPPQPANTELSVHVLTTGFWPMPAPVPLSLPPFCQALLTHFSTFYSTLHSGRRLTWHHSSSSAELRCQFDSGKRELSLHFYQAIILLLYNTADAYSFTQLSQLTQLPRTILAQHVLSLAHPAVRVLRKQPNTKAISDDDVFTYNSSYSSKFYRNKIPLLAKSLATFTSPSPHQSHPTAEATSEAGEVVPAAVMEARKNTVEAAVVRIMKSRKSMEHNALIAEVGRQLMGRFGVDGGFVKKRIEALIEREYIARDKDNRRLYHYLA